MFKYVGLVDKERRHKQEGKGGRVSKTQVLLATNSKIYLFWNIASFWTIPCRRVPDKRSHMCILYLFKPYGTTLVNLVINE